MDRFEHFLSKMAPQFECSRCQPPPERYRYDCKEGITYDSPLFGHSSAVMGLHCTKRSRPLLGKSLARATPRGASSRTYTRFATQFIRAPSRHTFSVFNACSLVPAEYFGALLNKVTITKKHPEEGAAQLDPWRTR